LGIIENLSMEDRKITLGAQDFLLMYTDGLTEAFSPSGDLFGEGRLLKLIKKTKSASVRGLLDGIETSVRHFMDPLPPSDDLTMLGIGRKYDR
jgi:phosphoserine phosphatase RsbU/P